MSYAQDIGGKHYYFNQTPTIIHFLGAEARELHFHKGTTPPKNEDISNGCVFWHEDDHILFVYNGTLWIAQSITLQEFTWAGTSSIETDYTFLTDSTRLWLADTYKRPGIQYYEGSNNNSINFWNSGIVPNGTTCAIEYRRTIVA